MLIVIFNMRGTREFCQRGSNLTLTTFFFLVDDGEEGIQLPRNRAIIGPPAKRHLNGVSLADR